jgi:Glycerophosphoryl diester phosphodiesterase family
VGGGIPDGARPGAIGSASQQGPADGKRQRTAALQDASRNRCHLKFRQPRKLSGLECGCPRERQFQSHRPAALRWSRPNAVVCAVLAVFLSAAAGWCVDAPIPLLQAHAHNDYEHKRPLLDALDHGFCSFEADIYLVDGQLLVAHNRYQVKTNRTLQSLYLDPLRERIRKNGGRVYASGPECTLLIDLKSDWHSIYPVLRKVLEQYADIFSTFRDGQKQTNAILAIVTGNRAKEMFAGETVRYAAYDGELSDLDSNVPAALIPWISSNYTFRWRGAGEFPESDKVKLKEIVRKAHEKGRRVRFWGAPDTPAFWRELLADGVDLINTDDLDGLEKFLSR